MNACANANSLAWLVTKKLNFNDELELLEEPPVLEPPVLEPPVRDRPVLGVPPVALLPSVVDELPQPFVANVSVPSNARTLI